MALPKRRQSSARRDKRRTHWKLSAPVVMECPNCNQPKLPHRACPNCGYYKDRMVFMPKES
ncbi:50S ribosomal protein L32 [candidate division KSB1 bacterium]|nr:50S ribosomal protein L32 [candidate division KSB1 bacterium]MBL7093280.1 50S ribosomal protein L32 [candidate division KSB1 bacterium]